MTKTEAAKLFGNQTRLAEALEITKSAVSQWPEDLDRRKADQVLGAALRLGLLRKGRASARKAVEATTE